MEENYGSGYGYGSGGYLTRFEDYYKSSDESEDEGNADKKPPPPPPRPLERPGELFEDYGPANSDDEEEEHQAARPSSETNGFKAESVWSPEERDWVPQSLVDLKLKIKPPRNFKGYDEEAYGEDLDDEDGGDEGNRVYSNNYDDVCKNKCTICSLEIDTDKLKNHMNSNHESVPLAIQDGGGESKRGYDVKTWHKCGVCGKAIIFTRVRLRYHVMTEHSMAVQDYNEKYMEKRCGRPVRVQPARPRRPSGPAAIEADWEADVDPTTVKEEEISNDYADIVKIECKICCKQVEKDNFRFLHLKKHGMDISDYKLVYGDPVNVKSSYHRCFICETIFVFTRSRLASHLTRHKVTVKDYGKRFLTKVKVERNYTSQLTVGEIDKDCMFSNDYEDECATMCKVCDRSLNYGNLGSHLYQSHSTRMKEYTEQYGEPEITKKSYHECAICHETLLFIRYHLVTHVKNKHNMSIQTYNKQHMQIHNVEYGDSNIMDKGRKVGTQKAPQWCDGTMYKCPYCFNIYYRYFTFRIHLINSHKMTDTEERSTCVRENEILTDIYRCKICNTQVKRDRMDIEAHLKQAHKTTLKIYTANFENSNLKESPKTVVAKLVRMGVLEEPSRSVCRTPKKLKAKPADQTTADKFVSVSENVPKSGPEFEKQIVNILSNEKKIKTEMPECKENGSLFHNYPTSPTNQILSNSSLPADPLALAKRKRKMPSKFDPDGFEGKSPKDEVGSAKRVKGSETVTSPLSQRNNNSLLSSPAKARPDLLAVKTERLSPKKEVVVGEEGGVLYRCPLQPCSWTCGKEGMRQGPAVLHLLRTHKIQPLEMRERGIKFDKINLAGGST